MLDSGEGTVFQVILTIGMLLHRKKESTPFGESELRNEKGRLRIFYS